MGTHNDQGKASLAEARTQAGQRNICPDGRASSVESWQGAESISAGGEPSASHNVVASGLAPGCTQLLGGAGTTGNCAAFPAPAPEELAWGSCQGDWRVEAHVII